jgi:starch phosphorylase
VSRRLFASLPRAQSVEGITNGVHARTWVSPELQTFYEGHLGDGWADGDTAAWSRVSGVTGEAFAAARAPGRARLVDLITDRTGVEFDPDGCIIGFARRFATYKRAALLLRDRDGLRRSLDAGAQFVFAGKAHPADTEGKAVLAEIAAFAATAEAQGRFALIPDYDIEIAQEMYAACDVWLNNPVRPREACGTSGEKSALNGGLNCSILDGWWADWYVDGIGWAIPTSDLDDPVARDLAESTALHELMSGSVLPTFADTAAWWSTTQAMLAHLGPLVTAGRMVAEYDERFYRPLGRR